MNRYFKPQVESLEERMVMDAAGTHVLSPDLVAPVQTETASINYGKIEFSYKPVDDNAKSHVGLGSANLLAFDTTTPSSLPESAADDVWIDGKIITAENYSSSPLNSSDGAGLDILIGNTGGDRTDNNGHGTHVAGTIGAAPSNGANFLFGDGSVRFVSDGIASAPAAGFGSLVDDTDTTSEPLPVLLVIANRDFAEPDSNSLITPTETLPSSQVGGGMGKVIVQDWPV